MTTKKSKPVSMEPIDVMYRAVAEYVESVGGRVIVAGGVQCQQWPSDGLHQFTIAVKCSGRKPNYTKSEAPHVEPK